VSALRKAALAALEVLETDYGSNAPVVANLRAALSGPVVTVDELRAALAEHGATGDHWQHCGRRCAGDIVVCLEDVTRD